ncbi:hypothetical protein SD98_29325 (plasmid) [Bacillus thuringiensis serovar morrisoni]|nr:hypothetical protein SD98_29325 [Bacillus thuringiensis serovar morrisoni]
MNLSISDELELFSKELQRYMSPDALEQLAKNVGFVKRKSKLPRTRFSGSMYLVKSKYSPYFIGTIM